MKNLVLILSLFLIACGEGSVGPSLDGRYGAVLPDGCSLVVDIGDDDTYETQYVCALVNEYGTYAGYGLEVESGFYTSTKDHITFNPWRSTCLDDDGEPFRLRYHLSQGNLVLDSGRVILNLERVRSSDVTQPETLELGCFEEDGSFTSSVLGDI